MKQYITIEDLNQLSEKGKKRLREWWIKNISHGEYIFSGITTIQWVDEKGNLREVMCGHGGSLYICEICREKIMKEPFMLFSIGQMIEFLGYRYWDALTIDAGREGDMAKNPDDVCDALWTAVKEILEKE